MNKNVFNNLSYGVYIVSCKNGDKYTGCTVNSIMQVTSSPATIALSLNKDNYTRLCIEENEMFAVSILSVQSNPLSIADLTISSGVFFPSQKIVCVCKS